MRTIFRVHDGEPFQRIGPADVGLPLKQSVLATADVEATCVDLPRPEAEAALGQEGSPRIRGRLVRLAADDNALLITMNYMFLDDWARKVLTRELCALAREDRADRLTPLPVLHANYTLWQRPQLAGEVNGPSEYWCPGWPRAARQDYSGSYRVRVARAADHATRRTDRHYGTTLVVTLLVGWALVLATSWSFGTQRATALPEIDWLIGFLIVVALQIIGFPSVLQSSCWCSWRTAVPHELPCGSPLMAGK
ncbi:hypothetical protein [Mesorhizobium sp. M0618]|uniref:hypothetical protein n=1 Tax=unclassified Mesorhizobium TaxID=325217 RepID=UPI00333B225E